MNCDGLIHTVRSSYAVRREDRTLSRLKYVRKASIHYTFIFGASSFSKTFIYHQSFVKEVCSCHHQKGQRV